MHLAHHQGRPEVVGGGLSEPGRRAFRRPRLPQGLPVNFLEEKGQRYPRQVIETQLRIKSSFIAIFFKSLFYVKFLQSHPPSIVFRSC